MVFGAPPPPPLLLSHAVWIEAPFIPTGPILTKSGSLKLFLASNRLKT